MASIPAFLTDALEAQYGPALTAEILQGYASRRPVTLRVNTLKATPAQVQEQLTQAGLRYESVAWSPEALILPDCQERDLEALPLYERGEVYLQSLSSMLPPLFVQPVAGENLLDMAAAPGGKTAYIAERLEGTGRVYAWDLHAHRVELIRATMRRLHLDNVRVAARDAMQVRDEFLGSMDAVLLDAPCSGLGVMDDKPDVKYRHTPESVAELCDTQRKLLDACCQYVRVGGTLVYSTCSMLKDENERQIARFLKDHPEFEIDALPDTVPSALRAHYGENGLQLLPCRDGVEGFFVARMKRRA